ncbi:putative spermidine/putrescine transport system ATP-binding protein [Stella humosa]|uniref:Spermidine/putrescine import ATP-binding protein PotA n=1 Tax=Stella humosa TaxID=94 RepID=A0A3N1MBW8_9PROT|nr:ABC transporter ATP-binding protein [Stella humosa]ROQ00250.1 putative spermidine/putrescine transport system ATP-binding protein [Stella humosa]BBK30513.1 polyamine-transporting ATPase [Stella humosa]
MATTSQSLPLSLAGIEKRFGAVTAIGGVDLAVEAGEFLTLLGPSGSGKTTLLKVIAGFEMPDRGTVRIGQADITRAPPGRRNIGMVFQNYALFPHLTVERNVAFPLAVRHVPRAEIGRRVQEALALVELDGYQARMPSQLSGGQQQRVALARAIVFNPGLLLLDEPFGALDRRLRQQLQEEVRRLQRRLGLTAIFVTHDQEEALLLSDRIAVMNGGAIEQLGPPHEIYARPSTVFAAGFIGESNLWRGTVANAGHDRVTIALDDGTRILAESTATPGPATALVRPERVRLLEDGEAADNRLSVTVEEVSYLGQTQKYLLRSGDRVLTAVWTLAAVAVGRVKAGDTVAVGWQAADVHVIAG